MKNSVAALLIITFSAVVVRADINEIFFDRPFFHHTDTLAPRDDWGLLHQSRTTLYETDFASRYSPRAAYYGMSGRELITQPAYVGALQRDLSRLGYYCGPIDGVFSDEVSEAIASLQKNYSQRVTGTLTVPVRRVLHLP
ncbi:MAG TPA: peptidoglycan-binding domain-containing protein [Chthoniobacterales bacterium]|nr:peptidoglycan-binding domain-containing protein [Chthoniobacterales bacterium]